MEEAGENADDTKSNASSDVRVKEEIDEFYTGVSTPVSTDLRSRDFQ